MIVFPNCKINLGLHVLRKRADGFHDISTIFYPAPIHDALELVEDHSLSAPEPQFSSSGISVDVNPTDQLCLKAWRLLKNDFPQLPQMKMHLHKQIPAGAGLGGGSANGAFTLSLLNRKFSLGLNDQQLMRYALTLGSDCPFFIINKPCIGSGRGEILEPVGLSLGEYSLVLVYPGIHISTAWAFSEVTPSEDQPDLKESILLPVTAWKNRLKNDFEEAVFSHHPAIRDIRDLLYEQGAIYASMSGSGSTVYGIFDRTAMPQLPFPPHYFVKSI